jgi:hypothetical protein
VRVVGETRKVLVWIAGDVSRYKLVKYRLGGGLVKSYASFSALAKRYEPDRLAVLVPSTLFSRDHCSKYRRLLKAKAGYEGYSLEGRDVNYGGDDALRDLIERVEKGRVDWRCYVIPHPGRSNVIELEPVKGFERRLRIKLGVHADLLPSSYAMVFTAAYLALIDSTGDYLNLGYNVEVYVDVTHGTNVAVSALLLASMLASVSLGRRARFKIYAAPVMGPLEEGVEVDVISMDEAVSAVREIIAGSSAWDKVDERLLPLNFFKEMGAKLGPSHKNVYGEVKVFLEDSEKLLWGMRSGQLPALKSLVDSLAARVARARVNLNKLVQREFPVNRDIHPDEWRNRASDPPWIPIVHAIISLTGKFLENLSGNTNEEFMRKAIRLLHESEYYDKVLGVAREWMVALTLRSVTSKNVVEVGKSPEWRQAETKLSSEPWFERTRQLRNKLQHGRISIEENAAVKLEAGDIEICIKAGDECKPLNVIDKKEVENVAKTIIDSIEKLAKNEA